jgi:hypothetical protein
MEGHHLATTAWHTLTAEQVLSSVQAAGADNLTELLAHDEANAGLIHAASGA